MRFVLSLLCGLFVSYLSWSQTGVGTLRGIVQQSEGPPIPGATVLVLGTTVGTATNEAGQFSFNDLPAQTYTLQISSVGFEEQSKSF